VTITGTSSPVTLGFNPEFLPQFSGIYNCIDEGQTFQEAVIITTGTPVATISSYRYYFVHCHWASILYINPSVCFRILLCQYGARPVNCCNFWCNSFSVVHTMCRKDARKIRGGSWKEFQSHPSFIHRLLMNSHICQVK